MCRDYLKIFILLFLVQLNSFERDESISDKLTIVFAGDAMQHREQLISAYDSSNNQYKYDDCFEQIAPLIETADLAIINLETTLSGEPYAGYPNFRSPDSYAEALSDAGFDIFLLANNHILDGRSVGLERTIEVIDTLGVKYIGSYRSFREKVKNYPFLIPVNGVNLAILNYTYGINGLRVKRPNVVNMINKRDIKHDLRKCEIRGADLVIVCLHWGVEFDRNYNKEQESIAKFCFQNGADLVIGAHPHVVQPIVFYPNTIHSTKQKITAYSLGNFISKMNKPQFNSGIMLQFEYEINSNNSPKVDLTDYTIIPVIAIPPSDSLKNFAVVPFDIFDNENDSTINYHVPESTRNIIISKLKSTLKGHDSHFWGSNTHIAPSE